MAFSYNAPDVAPKGALLERVVRLRGNSDYVEVAYTITPNDPSAGQSYINLSSVALGSMADENATVLRCDRAGDISLRKHTQGSLQGASWVALASRDGKELFGIGWAPGEFAIVEYERKDYSLLLRLMSPPWIPGEKSHTYHVRYLYSSGASGDRVINSLTHW